MKKRIVPVILILALAVGGYYGYRHITAEESRAHLYSGTVEATEYKISAEVSGRVLEVNADEGDKVQSGEVIVRIDTDTLEAQLAQAKAAKVTASGQLKSVNASIKNAGENLARSENLISAGSISQQNFDTVATQKQVLSGQKTTAYGAYLQAEAQAGYIDTMIAKATVKAPATGYVLHRHIEPGELAMPGAPLLTMADLDHAEVRVFVPETDLGKIKLGQKMKVHSDSYPNKTYEGSVEYISGEAEFTPKNVQTKQERVRLVYAVKLAVPNPDGELKIGMMVDVEPE